MEKTQFKIKRGEQFELCRDDIIFAMEKYDEVHRRANNDSGRDYAIKHNFKFYPPKKVLSLAIQRPVDTFNGGEGKNSANRVFQELDFEVINLKSHQFSTTKHDPKKIHSPTPNIEELIRSLFSQTWIPLHKNYRNIKDGQYPGTYIIAYSDKSLEDREVLPCDVFYVGMTHAGIFKRLKQFIEGLEGKNGHSGAKRFFKEFSEGIPYSNLKNKKNFFVATITIPCIVDKQKRTTQDLQKMGEVARLEYYVLAHIRETCGSEPLLNTK